MLQEPPERPVKAAAVALLCVLLAGCASSGAPVRLARIEPYICKHCNCYMPAGIADEATCPVCDCKKLAYQCRR